MLYTWQAARNFFVFAILSSSVMHQALDTNTHTHVVQQFCCTALRHQVHSIETPYASDTITASTPSITASTVSQYACTRNTLGVYPAGLRENDITLWLEYA